MNWDAYYFERRIDPKSMTEKQFQALPEYSLSIPTGVYFGKQWRCNRGAHGWALREYQPHPTDPKLARIVTLDWNGQAAHLPAEAQAKVEGR